jgi:hypothetical protein
MQYLTNFREEYEALRAKRRSDRTRAEQLDFTALPGAILVLKAKIEEVADELGGDEYRDIPGASSQLLSIGYLYKRVFAPTSFTN